MKIQRSILTVITLVLTFLIFQPGQPVFSQELKEEINAALNTGDTARAIELLNHEIELDHGYYYNYYILGMIYYNLMDYQKAQEQFEIAVDKKSKHLESQFHLGLCLLKLDHLDEAEQVMSKARKKAKDEKHIFENGYGLVMMAKEQYQDADRSFRAALVDNPDNPEYHINLGNANFYQGIPSLAISEYKKAMALDTASLEVYFHWAEACLEMKDYNCAIEKLRVVLSKDSTHAPAWMRAGGIYFKAALSSTSRDDRKNRFMETIGSYKRYLELSGVKPDSAHVRVFFELAMSYVNIFGFEDAAGYFNDVLSIPYEARDIYFYYGKSLWGIKDYNKSAEILLTHIDWVKQQDDEYTTNVNDVELYRLLGDCYYYRKPDKDFSTAIKYYKTSLESNPKQKRLVQNVAVAYHSMKSYAQACEFYNKRIDLGMDSTSSSIFKNAGYCALNIANASSGEEEELELEDEEEMETEDTVASVNGFNPDLNYFEVAVDYMKRYLEHNPEDGKVLLLVANTYLYQLADCQQGVTYFDKLLAVDPNSCDAKKAIGYAYFGGICTKDYTKALRHLHDAYECRVAAEGNCSDIDLALWIGQCYHLRAADKAAAKQDANDDFKNAFQWYGKVLKCDPTNEAAKKGQDDTRFEFFDENEQNN